MTRLRIVGCKITILDRQFAQYEDTLGRAPKKKLPLGADDLTVETIQRLAAWVEDYETNVNRHDLRLLGRHLYRCLFGAPKSELHKQFEETYAGFRQLRAADDSHRLRLRLAFDPDAAELATFPWEFLYVDDNDGGFFFAGKSTELILTRFIPPNELDALTPDEDPLNILVVVASPQSEELGTIDGTSLIEAVRRLEAPGRLDVRALEDNPRFSDIARTVTPQDGHAWWPDVLHFVGHGRVTSDGVGQLAMRAEEEQEKDHFAQTGKREALVGWVPTSKLLELFPDEHQPRLVFLHACKGAGTRTPSGSYRGFTSGAAELVRAGVPAVIAMQHEIQSEDALNFAQRFYEHVGEGYPIDDAVTYARWKVATTGAVSWSNRRFGTPLLFLQSQEAAILREVPGNGDLTVASRPEVPQGSDGLQRCPYRYDPTENCKGLVEFDLLICPICNQRLVWCSNHHPNMPNASRCVRCAVPIERERERTHAVEGQRRERSGHGTGFGR
jgi:hypothetical protein